MFGKSREATYEELVARFKHAIECGWRTSYRHGISERYCARAKNGVKHVEYTSAKLHLKDGKLFVKRKGGVEELTASVWVNDEGKEYVLDLRVKWLKSNL